LLLLLLLGLNSPCEKSCQESAPKALLPIAAEMAMQAQQLLDTASCSLRQLLIKASTSAQGTRSSAASVVKQPLNSNQKAIQTARLHRAFLENLTPALLVCHTLLPTTASNQELQH
jgi:hypothetical protein